MKVITIDALYGLNELSNRDAFDQATQSIDDIAIEITKYASMGLLSSITYNRLIDQAQRLIQQRNAILDAATFNQDQASGFIVQLNIFKNVVDGDLSNARKAFSNRTRNIFIVGGIATFVLGGIALWVVLKGKK